MRLPRLALPAVLALLLAGCAGTGGGPADAAGGTGTQGPMDPEASTDAAAPTWQVGQWWEWQTRFGTGTAPETFCSIVLVAGAAPMLGTEKEARAKQEAAFGHILLGGVGAGLALEGFGGSWDLLDFPLSDGKSWTASLPNVAWDAFPVDAPVSVAMTATYDPALPGYRIMGHAEPGMLLDATYLPATGWFGELNIYDTDPGQEGLELGFTAVATGQNYTGPVFTATADLLLQLEDGNGFTDFPTEGGQPFLIPEPSGQFTMSDGTTLYGIAQGASVLGGRVITLTDPAGQQRQAVATGTPEGEAGLFVDEPSIAGQWTLATTGAGGMSYAYAEFYELTVMQTTL